MSEAELATLATSNIAPSTLGSVDERDHASDSDNGSVSHVAVSDLEPDSPEIGAQKNVAAFLPALSVGTATASVSQAEAHAERSHAANTTHGGPVSSLESPDTLEAACQDGNIKKVEQILTPENLNHGGLHYAAANNHWRLCKLFLARGADVNLRLEPLNATPLMWACRSGHAYIVKLLLDHGADVNVTDSSGFTPLHLAVQSSNVLMVAYIAHLEVNADELDGGNRAPLHWAVVQNDHLTVEVLLKAGASPNLPDGEGVYPLYHAVYTSHSAEIVTLLLQHGADPFATLPDGNRIVDPENASDAWVNGCKNCGRLPSGLPRRSRILSPEVAKCISSVSPFFSVFLALSMTQITGTAWLGAPLGIITIWATKRLLEEYVVPICWPRLKPMMHSTALAGTFAGIFVWIVLYYLTHMFSTMFTLHPWGTSFIVMDMLLIALLFTSTLVMDPGIVHPKSMAVRLRNMNSLMDEGLFDSVHFCVHTYVVIPARASYDYYLERVVCRYDHYCPWVYNAVGIRNHRAFMSFLIGLSVGAPMVGKQFIEFWRAHEVSSFGIGLFVVTAVQMLWVTILTAIQIVQTARGTTSYEITHFKKALVYRTDPLKAFSSLPKDHPKAGEVLGPQVGQHHLGLETTHGSSASTPAVNGNHNHHDHSHSHGPSHSHKHLHGHMHHHHSGRSKWLLCFKLFGFHQLIMATRVLLHKSAWNKADNGILRNCADFWCAGGRIWNPDGARGAVGGVIVDYYTIRDLPSSNKKFRETEQMLV